MGLGTTFAIAAPQGGALFLMAVIDVTGLLVRWALPVRPRLAGEIRLDPLLAPLGLLLAAVSAPYAVAQVRLQHAATGHHAQNPHFFDMAWFATTLVVLMDLNLPDGSGVDATSRILALAPGTRVLMMTMSSDDDAVVAAMRAGARGYVVKGAGRHELLDAIRTVGAGGAAFSSTVADRLGRFFTGMATGGGREAFPQLTGREVEVLDLMARGLENRRIARELHLSDKTVRNHVSNVLSKLDVPDRSDAVARARAAGLG